MVVDVFSSYAEQPKGNLGVLSAGVFCAVVAVTRAAKEYAEMRTGSAISRQSIVTCGASGVLMGLAPPFSTRAPAHGNAIGPYGVTVFPAVGALLCCFIWNVYFRKKPLVGGPVRFFGSQ
jgi:glucose uptake protein